MALHDWKIGKDGKDSQEFARIVDVVYVILRDCKKIYCTPESMARYIVSQLAYEQKYIIRKGQKHDWTICPIIGRPNTSPLYVSCCLTTVEVISTSKESDQVIARQIMLALAKRNRLQPPT